MPSVLFGLALLAFWLYCLFDVITTPEEQTRNLPKGLWLILVVFLPDVGGLLWLLLGRPRAEDMRRPEARFPAAPPVIAPRGPDDDPEFLRYLDRRIRGREED